MNYVGTIIEESLNDKNILKEVKIIETKVAKVTDKHKTPWLDNWTLHKVEIPEETINPFTQRLSLSIDPNHDNSWYVDYKNERHHFIIFKGRIFQVDLQNPTLYKDAKEYGISIGIPEYQVSFPY